MVDVLMLQRNPAAGRYILLLLWVSFFLATGAASPCRAYNAVGFGDSITEGYGSSTGGYPPKLEALLNSSGQVASVLNYGLGGEFTNHGVARIDGVLAAQPTDYILILEGTNDALGGVSPETVRFNLNEMINKSRAAGAIPLISTLTPDSTPYGAQKHIEDAYNPMIHALAADTGTTLVDQYGALAPSWSTWNYDGLHPNDAGYQVMAETWRRFLPAGGTPISGGGGGGSGGGGGGCFIATAAFGSGLEAHVRLLSEFRDAYLLTNSLGREFVRLYYTYSPPIADSIADSALLRSIVRIMLYPFVGASYFLLRLELYQQMAAAFLLLLPLIFLWKGLQRPDPVNSRGR